MILKSKNLVCGYGKKPSVNPVIKNIEFEIEEGSRVAILGANGCGKTTLLRAIGGILPYEGSLQLDGKEVRDYKRRDIAGRLAVMTQLSQIYFSYTVEETVMFGRYLHTNHIFGNPDARDKEVVERCLRRNGLLDIRNRQIDELSGGQKQRVFLARTMAQETPLLLLDEPTNHLDLRYQAELMEYLKDWCRESKKHTLIGVFHDISMARSICNHFIVMKEGAIVATGSQEEAMSREHLQMAYDMDVERYMQKQLSFWN
ncbi:MAG: ABC transporter ATP-binding protein [Agathobacter sp.]|uniref:ABC transporter ATP-binding protein n=1 Tax=Agathobacter sp. TaxID=2021311 RepID=UPI00258B2B68|nr:ABC transporter ATP-binding protein [Agathobacter sp.]MCR5677928.1 ABC transporter ATP-binding protein [Agathobacter sp.]